MKKMPFFVLQIIWQNGRAICFFPLCIIKFWHPHRSPVRSGKADSSILKFICLLVCHAGNQPKTLYVRWGSVMPLPPTPTSYYWEQSREPRACLWSGNPVQNRAASGPCTPAGDIPLSELSKGQGTRQPGTSWSALEPIATIQWD